MRNVTIPESGPKRKLIEIAEGLLAERGFEAVSVRDITQLAGMNVAAVNYHFGSRDALLGAVMMKAVQPLVENQLQRLDALERKAPGKVVAVEALLGAMLDPLIGHAEESGLNKWKFYKLVGRIFAQHGDGSSVQVDGSIRLVMDRFMLAFQKSLPTIVSTELAWRLQFFMGAMIHMLMRGESRFRQGESGGMEDAMANLVKFTAAGLREGMVEELEKGPQVLFDF